VLKQTARKVLSFVWAIVLVVRSREAVFLGGKLRNNFDMGNSVATIFEGTVATVYGTAKKNSVGLFFFKKSQAQQAFLDKAMSSGRKAKIEETKLLGQCININAEQNLCSSHGVDGFLRNDKGKCRSLYSLGKARHFPLSFRRKPSTYHKPPLSSS
jgi:hypothetical protein